MKPSTIVRFGVAAALVGAGIVSSQLAGACPSCQPSQGQETTQCGAGPFRFDLACSFSSTSSTICGGDAEITTCAPDPSEGLPNDSVWVDFTSANGTAVCAQVFGTVGFGQGLVESGHCMAEEDTRGQSNVNDDAGCNSAVEIVGFVNYCIG